jgi:hypothetical protein
MHLLDINRPAAHRRGCRHDHTVTDNLEGHSDLNAAIDRLAVARAANKLNGIFWVDDTKSAL